MSAQSDKVRKEEVLSFLDPEARGGILAALRRSGWLAGALACAGDHHHRRRPLGIRHPGLPAPARGRGGAPAHRGGPRLCAPDRSRPRPSPALDAGPTERAPGRDRGGACLPLGGRPSEYRAQDRRRPPALGPDPGRARPRPARQRLGQGGGKRDPRLAGPSPRGGGRAAPRRDRGRPTVPRAHGRPHDRANRARA